MCPVIQEHDIANMLADSYWNEMQLKIGFWPLAQAWVFSSVAKKRKGLSNGHEFFCCDSESLSISNFVTSKKDNNVLCMSKTVLAVQNS